jgi:hypothetical protein
MRELSNSLRVACQLKLGLANPCAIPSTQTASLPATASSRPPPLPLPPLSSKHKQSARTSYWCDWVPPPHSALPDPSKCLGLSIGQLARLELGGSTVDFYPLSRVDEPGIVDLFLQKSSQALEFPWG